MIRRRFLLFAAVAATVLAAPAGRLVAAPEPSPVPQRWQLDFRPGPLRIATVDAAGVGLRTYFYFTYEVVNNSGKDLLFAPTFELAIDDGELLRSGQGVPSEVVNELLGRLRNEFLLDQVQMAIEGRLQQGEENGREGLVVWPANNLRADEVVVFASGFSGETKVVRRPDTGEQVTLRKVMMLRHDSPGELTAVGDRPFDRSVGRWILR